MSLSFAITRAVAQDDDPPPPNDVSPTRLVLARPPQEAPSVSVPVFERYEIRGELGRGGMGVVFDGYDHALKRRVAIKMILSGTLASLDALRRFQAETEAIGRLNHPNLVQIYETGQIDGRPYAVMEFIEGGTLAEHLASRPIPPNEAAAVVAELAEGIDFAHQKGVVHRDLKPANVLLNGTQPKIVDFGLAKFEGAAQHTQTGDVIGTPNYMAPERITDAKMALGPAVDIYALGAILFELLTGQMPFDGATPLEVVRAVVDREAPNVRTLRPTVARDLATICYQCLQKNPHKRYETAAALAADLQRYLQGEPILARPISSVEKVWRWSRRHPVIAFTGTTVLTILVGVAVVATMTAQRLHVLAKEKTEAGDVAKRETAEGEWRLYRSTLANASSNLQLNNNRSVLQALELAPMQHRRWEWDYFAAQLNHAECLFHNGSINEPNFDAYGDAQYSGDGRLVLLRNARTLLVYDARTYELRDTITAPELTALSQLSATGEQIRVLFRNGDLQRYDRGRRQWERMTLPTRPATAHEHPNIVFAPDRQQFAWYYTEAERTTIVVCKDNTTAQQTFTSAERLGSAQFSADGKYLMGCSKTGAVRWALQDSTAPRQIKFVGPHQTHFSISPKGRYLACSGGYPNNNVELWDWEQRTLIRELKIHRNTVGRLVFTPDEALLVTGSMDGSCCLWETQTGQLRKELTGHTQSINDLRVTPDGRSLVSSADDETIRLWDLPTGQIRAVLRGHEGRVMQLALNDAGTKLISGASDNTFRFWDLDAIRRRQVLGQHDNFVYAVAAHPRQPLVASASWDGTVREWELDTGRERRRFPQRYPVVNTVLYDSGGERLLAFSRPPHLPQSGLWEWNERQRQQREWSMDHPELYHEAIPAYSPDGQWLALPGESNLIQLWPMSGTGAARRYVVAARQSLPKDHTTAVAWHPQSKEFVCSTTGGRLVQWRIDQPDGGTSWEAGGSTPVAYSPDGALIASVGDRYVRLWDSITHECVATLAHGSVVYQAAFHPTQPRLVCACADNSIRVWDLTRYEEVADLRGHTSYVHSVAFTPSGERLISGSGDGTVRVWDARPIPRLPALYPPTRLP